MTFKTPGYCGASAVRSWKLSKVLWTRDGQRVEAEINGSGVFNFQGWGRPEQGGLIEVGATCVCVDECAEGGEGSTQQLMAEPPPRSWQRGKLIDIYLYC